MSLTTAPEEIDATPLETIISGVQKVTKQVSLACNIGIDSYSPEKIDRVAHLLLFVSSKKINTQGYWQGYHDFTPGELKRFLSLEEFAYLLSAYYDHSTRWSNEDDYSYYQIKTGHTKIVFHESDIRHQYTQEELDEITTPEYKAFCTLLPKEQETGKRDFWKLERISVRLS